MSDLRVRPELALRPDRHERHDLQRNLPLRWRYHAMKTRRDFLKLLGGAAVTGAWIGTVGALTLGHRAAEAWEPTGCSLPNGEASQVTFTAAVGAEYTRWRVTLYVSEERKSDDLQVQVTNLGPGDGPNEVLIDYGFEHDTVAILEGSA